MGTPKVRLTKNLRRNIKRGHPWVYKEALAAPSPVSTAHLCEVVDGKGRLAWALYDPYSPLTLRILSLDSPPPNSRTWLERLNRALQMRKMVVPAQTDCFRLLNGEGDLLPGLICDIYGPVAVLQFDGKGPSEFWNKEEIAAWLLANTDCRTVVEKLRQDSQRGIQIVAGAETTDVITVTENGVRFKVDLEKGQKTGFFMDQRDNRAYIRSISRGQSVLNLFSYTGGFSVYAGQGGAASVTSVDIAAGAIAHSDENWVLNDLHPSSHSGVCADVFDFLTRESGTWNIVIVDPPSMAKSEKQKAAAVAKYTELFAAAAKRVQPQGHLVLSSCSSHISFADFFEIITEALSLARVNGQILRVSGQGPDHPFPHSLHEFRYLKFVHVRLL